MVKLRLLAMLLISLMVSSGVVSAQSIDLLSVDDVDISEDVVGLHYEGLYYTLVFSDGVLQKMELDGSEEPGVVLTATEKDVQDLSRNYGRMGWLGMAGFFVQKFGLPLDYVIDLGGVLS